PPPRRLRGTTGPLRLRGGTPPVGGQRAGDGPERQENLGPWALAEPDLRAPNLRGRGRGSHAALRRGTGLRSATACPGHVTSGRCPSPGVQRASPALARWAAASTAERIDLAQRPATPRGPTAPPSCQGVGKNR